MTTAMEILDELIWRHNVNIRPEPMMTVLNCVENGKPIPNSCLPGRVIMRLPEEEREILKTLTSEQATNVRMWQNDIRR